MHNTLLGQVALCAPWALLPTILLFCGAYGVMYAYTVLLVLPLIIFYFALSSELKGLRFIIAIFLWILSWGGAYSFLNFFFPISVNFLLVLFTAYNAAAIAMVVILSHIIVKNRTKLKGQIALCVLFSLLSCVLFFLWLTNSISGIDAKLILITTSHLVMIIVLGSVFGTITKGKGYEFRRLRFIIATFLWGLYWMGIYSKILLYIRAFLDWLTQQCPNSTSILFEILIVLYVLHHAIIMAMVVLLSYILGKWIHQKRNAF